MHRWPGPEMEAEANEFASALLMPKNEVTIGFKAACTAQT
jgi:Zn-dependent peptidase ImmA (M78 family)